MSKIAQKLFHFYLMTEDDAIAHLFLQELGYHTGLFVTDETPHD